MSQLVAVIQGASRGLGLQFCRHILQHHPQAHIVATCRQPSKASGLQQLMNQYSQRLAILSMDVTDEEQVLNTSQKVKDMYGQIDLLINSAGMLHPSGKGETSLRAVSAQGLIQTVYVNAVGPVLVAKYFSPLLQKGLGSFGTQDEKLKHKGILLNISARVGSIKDNGLGGWYSYRMSKSALNMATKNLSIELGRGSRKVICIAVHPGTVDTDLSKQYHKNVPTEKLFSAEYSVSCIMNIVNDLSVLQTGKFFAWDGSEIPF